MRAILALQLKLETLVDPEPMLLIDDDQRQMLKSNFPLKQRVRTYDHLRIACCDLLQLLGSRGAEN